MNCNLGERETVEGGGHVGTACGLGGRSLRRRQSRIGRSRHQRASAGTRDDLSYSHRLPRGRCRRRLPSSHSALRSAGRSRSGPRSRPRADSQTNTGHKSQHARKNLLLLRSPEPATAIRISGPSNSKDSQWAPVNKIPCPCYEDAEQRPRVRKPSSFGFLINQLA